MAKEKKAAECAKCGTSNDKHYLLINIDGKLFCEVCASEYVKLYFHIWAARKSVIDEQQNVASLERELRGFRGEDAEVPAEVNNG